MGVDLKDPVSTRGLSTQNPNVCCTQPPDSEHSDVLHSVISFLAEKAGNLGSPSYCVLNHWKQKSNKDHRTFESWEICFGFW